MSSASLPQPTDSDGYDELAAIASDPDMRRHARRVAGDLADDVLQETWYLVAQARHRGAIGNLRGYFYRTMVNTSRQMRQELTRAGALFGDLPSVDDWAAPSAERDALGVLSAQERLDMLRGRLAMLWGAIPPYSADADRYRTVIIAAAESVLAGEARPDINEVLRAAYPSWFDDPKVRAATLHQRRCRARESVRLVLQAVVGRDDLRP